MNFAGPLVTFLWNLLPQRQHRSAGETLQFALHSFLWACALLLLGTQLSHTLDTYQRAQQEYRDALRIYHVEACATYNGPMDAKAQACSALSIVIQAWPLSRALIQVTRDWRIGLASALVAVTEQLQYKVALALLALALCSYAWKLFRCGKEKSVKAWHKKRYEETEKEMMARMAQKMQLIGAGFGQHQQAPVM